MRKAFKYILLAISLFCFAIPNFAKNKQKQKGKKVVVKAKKQTKKGSKEKSKEARKTIKLGQAANLNTLLENTNTDIKTVKADSIPEKVVTILSEFKPQLKNVAKINFNNASVQNDTTSIIVEYQVPSQNLSFQYRPISLVPRAFKAENVKAYHTDASIKAGFGNYLHRYINVNAIFNDAYDNTHSFGINNESITGLHHLQKSDDISFNYLGDIALNKHNQLQAVAFYKQSNRFRYGLVPDSAVYSENNYQQNYHHSGVAFSLINDNASAKSLHYNPSIQFEHFEGLNGTNNNWINFNSPLNITFKTGNKVNFDVQYSYNQYNPTAVAAITNSIFRLDPSLELNKFNSFIKLGVSPTFTKDGFNLYPIVSFSKKLTDTNYSLSAGWNTQLVNNSYTSLVATNPWINIPTQMEMTTHDKKYVAVQINAGKRMNYGFEISMNDYTNLPLFNKQMGTDRSRYGLLYTAIFEKKASTIQLDANLRYQFSDKLLVSNHFKYIQFNSLEVSAKPWGILPLELSSKLNWTPSTKWNLEAGLHYFTGAVMYNEQTIPMDAKNALDLHATINYKLSTQWNAWMKADNLLDRPYERWSDYPSLGVQLMAGVVYSFRK